MVNVGSRLSLEVVCVGFCKDRTGQLEIWLVLGRIANDRA